VSLCRLIVTPTRKGYKPARAVRPTRATSSVHEVYGTSDLEIERGYAKEVRVTGGDRSTRWCWLRGLGEGAMAGRDPVTSQQSVRQAVRRSALDAQAVRRKERAERQRRLEVWRSR